MRLCESNSPAEAKVSAEGWGGSAPSTGAEIPLQPMEQTMGREALPCSSWSSTVEQIPTCSPWRSTVEQISICSLGRTPHRSRGMCLKEAVTPWGAHAGAGSCQDLQTHGERSPHQSRFADRACDPMGTHSEAACSGRTAPHGKDPLWGSS